ASYYVDADNQDTGTTAAIAYAVEPFIAECGDTAPEQLRPSHVKEFRQSLIASGMAHSTINRRINQIKAWLRWCVDEELLPGSVEQDIVLIKSVRMVRLGAKVSEAVTAVAWSIEELTLPHLPPTLQVMVLVQWWTACRPQDVYRMTWGEIDVTRSPWLYSPSK